MKSHDTTLVLTHFISQTFEKWLDVRDYWSATAAGSGPAAGSGAHQVTTDIAELAFTDWQEVLALYIRHNPLKLTDKTIARIEENSDRLLYHIHGHFDFLLAEKGSFLAWNDSRYPEQLRYIPDPPTGLSLIGPPELLRRQLVAMVGSRKASGFSMAMAETMAKGLIEEGAVVVSGGAYGCDTGAHTGALAGRQSPCPTIVVFAGGLAKLYPRGNRRLFQDIYKKQGVFMSERLWNAPYLPRDFPVRNRIISGLADGVVVIQAAEKSGAMVTAHKAIDHGRELLVLKQDADDVRSRGNLSLLAMGATAVSGHHDIIDALTQ